MRYLKSYPNQPNPLVDTPTEEQQELDHPADNPIEEHPTNAPAEDAEQPQIQATQTNYQYSHPFQWQTMD